MNDNTNSKDFNGASAALVPMVVEREGNSERSYDLFSRLMKDRIVFVAGPVTMESSLLVVAQLLHIKAQADNNPALKEKGVDIYIMSPGGAVDGGNAIIDTMNFLKDNGITVRTTAMGLAMSMGSAILVNGTPGERRCLPSTRIMLHEPSGGSQGKTKDMAASQREINHMKTSMTEMYLRTTGMSVEDIKLAMDDVDCFMYGEEAKRLGVIDEVAYPQNLLEITQSLKAMNELHETRKKESRSASFIPPGRQPG
jgi:ATP-dependent Clp protease protease subunit